jgi:Ca2+-binding EF-hand superfamily protein
MNSSGTLSNERQRLKDDYIASRAERKDRMKRAMLQKMLLELSSPKQQNHQQEQKNASGNSLYQRYPAAPRSEASVGGDEAPQNLATGKVCHAQQTIEGFLGNLTAANVIGEQSSLYLSPADCTSLKYSDQEYDEEYSDDEEYDDEEYDEDGDDEDKYDDRDDTPLSSADIGIALDGSFSSSLIKHGQGEMMLKQAEEKARKEAEEKVKREAEEKARKEAEEKAKRETEEQAKSDSEERARKEAKREAAEKTQTEAKVEESVVEKSDAKKTEVGKNEGETPAYGSTQLRKQARNVLTIVKAHRRMSWQESADAYDPLCSVTALSHSPDHGKSTTMTRKADKWRKVRVHLQDQHTMVKFLWKHTMDKDDTGLIDFHEFRLYAKFALHNVDFQFCNRLDERLQTFFLRISQSEHINGMQAVAVAKWRPDRTLNFLDEHGLMKDPAWPFYKSNIEKPLTGQKLIELMDSIHAQWTLAEDEMLQTLIDTHKNPNPLQKRSKRTTTNLWNDIDKKLTKKNLEECRFRAKYFKLEKSLHENGFISYLFNLYDPNDSGMLTFDEFVQGCMHHGLDSRGRLGICKPCPGPDKKGYPKHHGDVVGPLAYNMIVQEGPEKIKHLLSFNSLSCLSHTNYFRKICLRLIKRKAFDMVILIAILFNSIVLAIEDYQDPDRDNNPTFRNQIVDSSEMLFTVIFTFECVVKVSGLQV